MSFAVDHSSGPDGVCVAVAGEVDIDSAPRMRQALAAAVAAGESVTVDLSAVTFIDSSGLAALISTHRAAEAAGLTFLLQRVPPAILKLLALTGMDTVLSITPPTPAEPPA